MKLIKSLLTIGTAVGIGYGIAKKEDIGKAIKNSKPVQTGAQKLFDFSNKIINK